MITSLRPGMFGFQATAAAVSFRPPDRSAGSAFCVYIYSSDNDQLDKLFGAEEVFWDYLKCVFREENPMPPARTYYVFVVFGREIGARVRLQLVNLVRGPVGAAQSITQQIIADRYTSGTK